jgi:hypothetical protein
MRFGIAIIAALTGLAMATPTELGENNIQRRWDKCPCTSSEDCGCSGSGNWCYCINSDQGGNETICTEWESCGCTGGYWGQCLVSAYQPNAARNGAKTHAYNIYSRVKASSCRLLTYLL